MNIGWRSQGQPGSLFIINREKGDFVGATIMAGKSKDVQLEGRPGLRDFLIAKHSCAAIP
jgi:hypothetical protein